MSRLVFGDINEFDDDDDEFNLAYSRSKLKSLFGNDMIVEDNPLTYTAPVNPKHLKNNENKEIMKLPAIPVNINNTPLVTLAMPVQAYKLENYAFTDFGRLSLALIMNSQLKEHHLILYLTRDQILSTVNIKFDFQIKVLENNYIYFLDDSNFNWSILFGSNEERIHFLRKIAIVKALITVDFSGSLLQDLSIVTSEETSTVMGDNVEIEYSSWILNGYELSEQPIEDKLIKRFRIGKKNVVKIFEDSVLGMKVASQRFIICHLKNSHLYEKIPNDDSNRLIAILILLKKIKSSKLKKFPSKIQENETIVGDNIYDPLKSSSKDSFLIESNKDHNEIHNDTEIKNSEENKNYPIKPDKSQLLKKLAKYGPQMLPVPSENERRKRSLDLLIIDNRGQTEMTQKSIDQNNSKLIPVKNLTLINSELVQNSNNFVGSTNDTVLLTEPSHHYLEIKNELSQLNNKLDIVHNAIENIQKVYDLTFNLEKKDAVHTKFQNITIKENDTIKFAIKKNETTEKLQDSSCETQLHANENQLIEEFELSSKIDLASEKYIPLELNEESKKLPESNNKSVEIDELLENNNMMSSELNVIVSEKNLLSSQIHTLSEKNNSLSMELYKISVEKNAISLEKDELSVQLNSLISEKKSLFLEKDAQISNLKKLSEECDNYKLTIEKLTEDNLNLQKELNDKNSQYELLQSKLNLFRKKTSEMKEFYETQLADFNNKDLIQTQVKSIMNRIYKQFMKHFITDEFYAGSGILEKAMEIIKQCTFQFISNDNEIIAPESHPSTDQNKSEKLIKSPKELTSINTNLNRDMSEKLIPCKIPNIDSNDIKINASLKNYLKTGDEELYNKSQEALNKDCFSDIDAVRLSNSKDLSELGKEIFDNNDKMKELSHLEDDQDIVSIKDLVRQNIEDVIHVSVLEPIQTLNIHVNKLEGTQVDSLLNCSLKIDPDTEDAKLPDHIEQNSEFENSTPKESISKSQKEVYTQEDLNNILISNP